MLSKLLFRRSVSLTSRLRSLSTVRCWARPVGAAGTSVVSRSFASGKVKVPLAQVKALRDQTGAPIVECREALAASVDESGEFDVEKALTVLRKKGVDTAAKKAGRAAADGLVSSLVSPDGKLGVVVELNSETDFVARNTDFQQLAANIARTAMTLENEDLDALNNASLANTESTTTVAQAVTDSISTIRENIQLRRFAQLRATEPNGRVVGYAHNVVGQQDDGVKLGRIGALVGVSGEADADAMEDVGSKLAMHIVAANPAYATREDVPEEVVAKERAIVEEQARASGKPAKIVDNMVRGRLNKFFEEIVLVDQTFVVGNPTDGGKPPKVSKYLAANKVQLDGYVKFVVGDGVEQSGDEQSFDDEVNQLAFGDKQ